MNPLEIYVTRTIGPNRAVAVCRYDHDSTKLASLAIAAAVVVGLITSLAIARWGGRRMLKRWLLEGSVLVGLMTGAIVGGIAGGEYGLVGGLFAISVLSRVPLAGTVAGLRQPRRPSLAARIARNPWSEESSIDRVSPELD